MPMVCVLLTTGTDAQQTSRNIGWACVLSQVEEERTRLEDRSGQNDSNAEPSDVDDSDGLESGFHHTT